jgi:rhodanese-related sulfurtransferase/rubrerythrin
MTKIACAVDNVTRLAPSEIKAILDQDKKGEFLLLDVRQPEEYEVGHIPGAMLIPLGELEIRKDELDPNRKIITYCRSGRRSMAAAIALCGLGFESVYHLDGGILAWPYETIAGIPQTKPELITEAAEVRDVFVLAIKLEKGSRDFYVAARDKVVSPKAREILQMLAEAEEAHMRKLYGHAFNLLHEEVVPPLEKFERELKVEHMEGGIEINPALAEVHGKFGNEMDALEIALEKEYMSYDFYKRTSAVVANADAKNILHELAVEERNHADILLKRLAELVRQ